MKKPGAMALTNSSASPTRADVNQSIGFAGDVSGVKQPASMKVSNRSDIDNQAAVLLSISRPTACAIRKQPVKFTSIAFCHAQQAAHRFRHRAPEIPALLIKHQFCRKFSRFRQRPPERLRFGDIARFFLRPWY